MSESGPTTVGSIVGKLKMDRDQWVAAVAATKAEIRDLESSDPDIRIDTNAKSVMVQLAEARAAADALGGAQEDLGRKTRRTADETIRANEANRTSVTRVGAIATAVALLVPLLTPVGAAAIGVGGALLGMGTAGVLALYGIHREMQQGTVVGGAFRDGIDSLKGSMGTLASTAAVNMLSSFRRVVAETRDALPGLNTQVGQFSSLLGRSGANLFTGTLNSLRVLNPLLMTAGVYVLRLTEGFQAWTQGSGIEDFGEYALAALPQVTDVLGKLASMVLHILEALAPLGTIGLAVLAGVSDVINGIPVEILSQLIVTLTWGAIAFKAWGFVAPMLATIATSMGAVGAATTIATGPIGWVVAGLAALAGVLATIIVSNQGAAKATMEYTAAVEADSGAIGENTRLKVAQKLADNGVLEAAKKLGASLEDVTGATLGQADSMKALSLYTRAADGDVDALNQVMKETGLNHYEVAGLLNTMVVGFRNESAAVVASAESYELRTEAMETTTTATRAQQAADEAAAGALGISVGALQAARSGQEGMESSTAKATAEMYLQGDAAGLLRQALDVLNGKQLSAAEAQNQFESQLVRLPQFTDEASAALSGMSQAAVDNRGSLLDLIQSSQNSALALRDQGASSDEVKQKMIDGRQAIIDQAVANGMNRDEVTRYIEELYKIPDQIPKTKIEVDTATAEAQLQTFLANVSNRVAWVQVKASLPDLNGSASGSGRPGVANGGTIPGLAGGGSGGTVLGPGNAHSDTAGLFRLAHGEEVVSDRFGQATRNRSLLKAINAGYTPAPAAGFATRAVQPAASAPTATQPRGDTVVNVSVNGTQQTDPRVLGEVVGARVRRGLVGVNR